MMEELQPQAEKRIKTRLVLEAVAKAGLTLVEVTRQGEWVCVTARKD